MSERVQPGFVGAKLTLEGTGNRPEIRGTVDVPLHTARRGGCEGLETMVLASLVLLLHLRSEVAGRPFSIARSSSMRRSLGVSLPVEYLVELLFELPLQLVEQSFHRQDVDRN